MPALGGQNQDIKKVYSYIPVSYTHLDVYKRQRLSRTGRGRHYIMARFYGLRVKAGIMKLNEVPKLWRSRTEVWLEQNRE